MSQRRNKQRCTEGLPKFSSMPLIQLPAPFDDPDFLYEVASRYEAKVRGI